MSKLIYRGQGRWLRGIPARDLSAAEVKKFGKERLLATGLYVETTERKAKKIQEVDYDRYQEVTSDTAR